MQVLRAHPLPPMESLLLTLVERAELSADAESVARAIADARDEHWTEAVDDASEALGLRPRWIVATTAEAAGLSSHGFPLVTCAPDRLGRPRWWMVDGARLGRVRLTRLGDGKGAQWLDRITLRKRIGTDEFAWAMVEPLLPAARMAARTENSPHPLRRLVGLFRAERREMMAIGAYALALGLLSLATPLAMQVLINWLAFGALLQPVLVLGAALFIFLALAAAMRTLQRLAVETVQRRLFVRLSSDLAARLSRVELKSLDRTYGPELVNRFFDVLTVQKATRTLFLDGLAALLQALVGLVVLAVYHPALLGFDLALVVAIALVWGPAGRGGTSTAILESKRKYEVAGWIEEVARHPLLFKLGGAALGEVRADRLTRGYLEARASHFAVFLRQYVGMQGVQVIASTSLLVLCGWLVLEGELSLGQLVAAEFIMTSALAGLAKFTDKLDTTYDLLAAVDKIGALVDLPGERSTGLRGQELNGPATVVLEDVAFQWPSLPGGFAGLSLALEPGSRTAIVGGPGSGKSLLADLVLGARTPTAGRLVRDGLDARMMHPEALYRDVALLRGTEVFAGSIRDNLSLGRQDIDSERMLRALERVGLGQVIALLADGLDTELAPTGAPLSEGHVRALMVGRALVARPRLLVVDGFFDGLSHEARNGLLRPILSDDSPFTLLVLTQDRGLARLVGPVLELHSGGLRARPRLSPV
ncbi:MAG: ATP-binding cassette domain-containing protein [Proteobacteria bacterium]|nr:ATP-binding cassette domain-containing protein [Pseudomonadota bacterium]